MNYIIVFVIFLFFRPLYIRLTRTWSRKVVRKEGEFTRIVISGELATRDEARQALCTGWPLEGSEVLVVDLTSANLSAQAWAEVQWVTAQWYPQHLWFLALPGTRNVPEGLKNFILEQGLDAVPRPTHSRE